MSSSPDSTPGTGTEADATSTPDATPQTGRDAGATSASYTLVGAALAASAAVLWGSTGSLVRKLLLAGITPLTLVESRSLVAVVGMGLFLLVAGRSRLRVARRDVPLLVLFGLSVAVVTYAYFLAVKLLPVAIAVMVQYTGPTMIALYTALATRRLPAPRIWLALALTLAGVGLLAGIGGLGGSQSSLNPLGLLVALGSAVAMALYILVGERLGKRVHPQTSVFYGFGIALLLWLVLQPPWSFQTAALAPSAWPLVLGVGVLGTLIPFGLFLTAIRRLDATRAAIISTLEPVTAAAVAWVWLGEGLDAWQVLGGALVLVGVTVVQLRASRRAGSPL
ncbi:MAG TPA: EamA family transporter [Ktedonobacterales bacterium]